MLFYSHLYRLCNVLCIVIEKTKARVSPTRLSFQIIQSGMRSSRTAYATILPRSHLRPCPGAKPPASSSTRTPWRTAAATDRDRASILRRVCFLPLSDAAWMASSRCLAGSCWPSVLADVWLQAVRAADGHCIMSFDGTDAQLQQPP